MSTVLTPVLEGEQLTVYAYGVLGAKLSGARLQLARAGYDAHRLDRDALISRMRTRGITIPTSPPAYDVSTATPAQAVELAVRLETSQAVLWCDLVGQTDEQDLRLLAVRGLSECAVRATRWRLLTGLTPATDALPGQV